MSEPFRVNYIDDTQTIINAALEGSREFILNTDDVNKVLSKYDISVDSNKELTELLMKADYNDWFNIANDKKHPLQEFATRFLKDFTDKFAILKTKNKNFYITMVKLFNENTNMSDEEAWNFVFPELKYINGEATVE